MYKYREYSHICIYKYISLFDFIMVWCNINVCTDVIVFDAFDQIHY